MKSCTYLPVSCKDFTLRALFKDMARWTPPAFILPFLIAVPFGNAAITPEMIDSFVVRSPLPTAASLEGVTSDGQRLVGVGTRGGAVKSLDGGLTWSEMPPIVWGDTRQDMYGVATDGSRFVAVGSYAAVTTDLETWEVHRFNPHSFNLDVAYGGGKFVAVGRRDSVNVSPDGVTWEAATLPEGTSLEAIAFGDGVFVGVGTSARIVRSTDAVSWTITHPDVEGAGRLRSVSYANGQFIAGGDQGLFYTSPDGITWSAPAPENTLTFGDVVYHQDQYIFLDTLSTTHLSTDLSTFTRNAFAFPGGPNAITKVGDSHIAVVGREGLLATSSDGTTWTERRERLGRSFSQVVFGSDLFVINDLSTNRLFSSADGAVWTQRYEADRGLADLGAYGNGVFCFFDSDWRVLRSADGKTWERAAEELGFIPYGMRFLEGQFVVVGRDGMLATSTDAATWTFQSVGTTTHLRDVNVANDTYVAVGDSGDIYTSPDLQSWTTQSQVIEGADAFRRVEVTGDTFYLFQIRAIPATSTDGVTWAPIEGARSYYLQGSGVDETLGVYQLSSGQIVYLSPDAEPSDWEIIRYHHTNSLRSLTSGNGHVIGVGTGALIVGTPLENEPGNGSLTGYDAWAGSRFAAFDGDAVRGRLADPDGDGASNFEEYVRGTEPRSANGPLRTTATRGSFGPEIQWTQRAGLDDVEIVVEHSFDLQSWSTEGVGIDITHTENGEQTVEARVTGDAGQAEALFMRIRWESQR